MENNIEERGIRKEEQRIISNNIHTIELLIGLPTTSNCHRDGNADVTANGKVAVC